MYANGVFLQDHFINYEVTPEQSLADGWMDGRFRILRWCQVMQVACAV